MTWKRWSTAALDRRALVQSSCEARHGGEMCRRLVTDAVQDVIVGRRTDCGHDHPQPDVRVKIVVEGHCVVDPAKRVRIQLFNRRGSTGLNQVEVDLRPDRVQAPNDLRTVLLDQSGNLPEFPLARRRSLRHRCSPRTTTTSPDLRAAVADDGKHPNIRLTRPRHRARERRLAVAGDDDVARALVVYRCSAVSRDGSGQVVGTSVE